jgi:2-haloacid dehalogenase
MAEASTSDRGNGSAIKAVLWDYGNVLVHWDPRLLYRQMFTEAREVDWFLENVCTMAWHLRHDQGVPMAENAAPLKERFPEYAAEIDAWRLRFGDMLGGEIPGIGALVDAFSAQGLRQGILTNMPGEVAELCFDGFTRLGAFNAVTVSGFERVAKPDPEAFLRALIAMGAEPEETVFIDDSRANVAAAETLGMRGVVFTGAADLKKSLAALGMSLTP